MAWREVPEFINRGAGLHQRLSSSSVTDHLSLEDYRQDACRAQGKDDGSCYDQYYSQLRDWEYAAVERESKIRFSHFSTQPDETQLLT